jgi:adenylate kinase family enzyme
LSSIKAQSLGRFGFKERMKLERTLFLILRAVSISMVGYDIPGFTDYYKQQLIEQLEGKNQCRDYIHLIQKIYSLKQTLQSLSSENGYVRGDTLSKLDQDRRSIFGFLERQIKSINDNMEQLGIEDATSGESSNSDETHHGILVLGAAGSGTTSIAKRLSNLLNLKHIETDDLLWSADGAEKYSSRRNYLDLRKLVESTILSSPRWVISGSLCGWGDEIIHRLDCVIFLDVPVNVRLERIKHRENQVVPMGNLNEHENEDRFNNFYQRASLYDSDSKGLRTRVLHEEWLAGVNCNIIRLSGTTSVEEAVSMIMTQIDKRL